MTIFVTSNFYLEIREYTDRLCEDFTDNLPQWFAD